MKFIFPALSLIVFLAFTSLVNAAVDTVKISGTQSAYDQRAAFKNQIIHRALQVTAEEYGAYQFILKEIRMNRVRALPAIIKGELNNVYIAPSVPEWNEKTLAIKLPIRMGLLSYRVLLIHKDDAEKFSKVRTLEDLKALKVGLHKGSSTGLIYQHHQINYAQSQTFDGLFLLLNSHRFEYIPRTIYEVFDELETRADQLPNVMVEPTLLLNIPTPTYIYVSPNAPNVAKRLEQGIEILFKSGELLNIVEHYYKSDIERANLQGRRVITIDNPFYSDIDKKNDEKYWYKL